MCDYEGVSRDDWHNGQQTRQWGKRPLSVWAALSIGLGPGCYQSGRKVETHQLMLLFCLSSSRGEQLCSTSHVFCHDGLLHWGLKSNGARSLRSESSETMVKINLYSLSCFSQVCCHSIRKANTPAVFHNPGKNTAAMYSGKHCFRVKEVDRHWKSICGREQMQRMTELQNFRNDFPSEIIFLFA